MRRDIEHAGVQGVSGRNSEAGRSVLNKAFAILDALREAQVDLTRAQLARRTGLPMTTVHRLATQLCEHGALELTEHKTYRVGPWLWEIGTLSAHTRTFRYVALPFMQDLYEATHENVQLAVPDGFDALVVERVRGRTSVPHHLARRRPPAAPFDGRRQGHPGLLIAGVPGGGHRAWPASHDAVHHHGPADPAPRAGRDA